nr:hypothetical protein [Tanacetum cinerariifolium]
MVGLGKLFGTVPMCCRCTGNLGRGGLVLAGNSGMGTVWEARVLGFGRNGPSVIVRFLGDFCTFKHNPYLVAARSSPPSSPTRDLSPTDVTPPTLRHILPAPPELPRQTAVIVLPSQTIPLGRPYRTQPNRTISHQIPHHSILYQIILQILHQANIDVDTAAAEAAAVRESDGGVEVGFGSDREDDAKEEAESRDKGTIEIRVDRVLDIENAQRE